MHRGLWGFLCIAEAWALSFQAPATGATAISQEPLPLPLNTGTGAVPQQSEDLAQQSGATAVSQESLPLPLNTTAGTGAVPQQSEGFAQQSGGLATNETETPPAEALAATTSGPADDLPPDAENLCIDGKVAPELFVIGAARASTTFFAARFSQSVSVVLSPKEVHSFDNASFFDESGGKNAFLSNFPDCLQTRKLFAFDGTPTYLSSTYAPQKIREVYEDAATRLRFLVILREPIRRMYSAYSNLPGGKRREVSFQELVDQAVMECRQSGVTTVGIFEETRYAELLQRWFKVFKPSQFIVAPMLYVVNNSAVGEAFNQTLEAYMWDTFGLSKPPRLTNGFKAIMRTKYKVSLEDALRPQTLIDASKLLYYHTGPTALSNVLHNSGATLYGCGGCSKLRVIKWIADGWG